MSKNEIEAKSSTGGQAAKEYRLTGRKSPRLEFPLYVTGTQSGNEFSGDGETLVIRPHSTRCECGRDISQMKWHCHNLETGECTCAFFSCQGIVACPDSYEVSRDLSQEAKAGQEATR